MAIRKSKMAIREQHRQHLKDKNFKQKKHNPKQNNHVKAIKTAGIEPQRAVKQTYLEIKNRITPEILSEMLNMLQISDNLGTFYQHWTAKHDDKFLVVLGLIDEETREELAYLDKKSLIDLATTTDEQSSFNKEYFDRLKAETQQALSEVPLENLNNHDTNNFIKFPNVYLLSDKDFYEKLKEWSLPFELRLIYTEDDIQKFTLDKNNKIVVFQNDLTNALPITNRREYMLKLSAYIKNHNIDKIFLYGSEESKKHIYYLKKPNRETLIKTIRQLRRKDKK